MRNSLATCLASCALTLVIICPLVFGQNAERRQNFDRIYKGLVDSRMSSQRELTPVPQNQISSQMRNARQGMQRFNDGLRQLSNALRQEEWYTPAIRPLLGDALQVQAAAEILVNRSQGMRELSQFIPDYEQLDRQWRVLAHRVEQWPALRQSVYQQVTSLNQMNDNLGTLLKVTPQFEVNELLNQLASLTADFDRLSADIEFDLAQDPQQQEYLRQLRRLQSMVYYLRQAANANRPHEELVGRFKQMHGEWLPLKNKFRLIDNRYIQRSMTRIAQSNDRIHNLLWIPKVIDGNEILALATTLKQNVDQIADQVSLRRLLESPNATAIFERAKDFYALCGDFRQSVATESDLQALRWDFRELDVSWNDLRVALAHSTDPQTLQHLATVDFTVSELRESLGERPVFDNNEAIQLIASIDSLAELLHLDINHGIANSNRYDQNFRSRIVRSSQLFHRSAHTLQQQITQNTNDSTIRQGTTQLVNQWRELQGYVSQVTFDHPQTVRNAQQISQSLAKLQVIYTF